MKNKAFVTIRMAPIFVNVPTLDNKTKHLGFLDRTCEHSQHHYHFPSMLRMSCSHRKVSLVKQLLVSTKCCTFL